MRTDESSHLSSGKRIALYPGAFRPPHAAHMHAVQYLANHPDIDEVVIIISGRFRHIPGTDLALGPEVAEAIWQIYLEGLTNVRVVIASQTAVSYALDYFDKVLPDQTLLFCIGEADLQSGDSRFYQIHQRAKETGISASIIMVPTGDLKIRSTALRASLVDVENGSQIFMDCLPNQLNLAQRMQVWAICQNGWKTVIEVTRDRIQKVLSYSMQVRLATQLLPGKNRLDPVFFTQTEQGEHWVIKFAGSSLEVENNAQTDRPKSRNRLSVERLALKWLNHHFRSGIKFPETLFWMKKEKMLIMTRLGFTGHSLAHRLSEGYFDRWVLNQVNAFLADNYHADSPAEAFWGDQSDDKYQWQQILEEHLKSARSHFFNNDFDQYLRQLKIKSLAATRHQLVHLDLQPKHILLSDNEIAIVDWESSSTFGDPAFDLGKLLGHFLFYAIQAQQTESIVCLIEEVVLTFQSRTIGTCDHDFISRVYGFIGSTLLSLGQNIKESQFKQLTACVRKIEFTYYSN